MLIISFSRVKLFLFVLSWLGMQYFLKEWQSKIKIKSVLPEMHDKTLTNNGKKDGIQTICS